MSTKPAYRDASLPKFDIIPSEISEDENEAILTSDDGQKTIFIVQMEDLKKLDGLNKPKQQLSSEESWDISFGGRHVTLF